MKKYAKIKFFKYILLCTGSLILATPKIFQRVENFSEKKEIENFYKIDYPKKVAAKANYISILKIPKINLQKGLFNPNSSLNNIDKNIQILENSVMPGENGNIFLAAHSGTSNVSYFKNLGKLGLGDLIVLDFNNKSYNYYVNNIYEIEKTGELNIDAHSNNKTLVLITCVRNSNKQLVVEATMQT